MASVCSLTVVVGVEVYIVDNDHVRSSQTDAQATGLRREEEYVISLVTTQSKESNAFEVMHSFA